jgi:hypothetical protein
LRVRREGDGLLVEGATDPAEVTRLLAEHDLYVHELTPRRPDLESVFLQLTRDTSMGAGTVDTEEVPA